MRVLCSAPHLLWRAILNDFRNHPSLAAYARSLYWQYRLRFPQRFWNVSRGALGYAAVLAQRAGGGPGRTTANRRADRGEARE